MRAAEWINTVFFSLFVLLAFVRPIGWRRRGEAIAIGGAGLALTTAGLLLGRPSSEYVRDWLPAPLMLMVYWQSGRFFTAPSERLQERLTQMDQRVFSFLGHGGLTQGWLRHYLELAYLVCYLLVPLGVAVLYATGQRERADDYWAGVLPATYLCYVLLPFVQTLPPRMLTGNPHSTELPRSKIRELNLLILDHASITVNTFPSAHVTATMAASLALIRFVPFAGAVFLLVSINIALGAVLGRYHYWADAVLGAALALGVFLIEALWL